MSTTDLNNCPMCQEAGCINEYDHTILGDRRTKMAVCNDCGFTCWKADWNEMSERVERLKRIEGPTDESASEPSCDCQHDTPDRRPKPDCHCAAMR